MATPDSQVSAALAPVVEESGLVLESVRTKRAGSYTSLEVVVDLPDGPGGVTDTQLADVTRAVSAAVDELDPIAGTFTLEVTTPGIDRPLTCARHFRRALGHIVEIASADGQTARGRITDATDTQIVITGDAGERTLALADVASARMVVEW